MRRATAAIPPGPTPDEIKDCSIRPDGSRRRAAAGAPNCGIHGTSGSPRIGRRESHECIPLIDWDARELSLAVKKGIPVVLER